MTSLLPPNATPLERALDAVGAARLDAIPVPVTDATRPHVAPAAFLPFLAWARSVDLWDGAWPEETRRAVVADAVRLHRLKGTLAGIRAHVAWTRGEVVDAVVPPQGFFLGGDEEARWDAWRASLGEVRLFADRAAAPENGYVTAEGGPETPDEALAPGAFLGDEASGEPTFFMDGELPTEWAVLVSRGAETPVSIIRRPDPRWGRTGEVIDLAWPGEAGLALFANDAASADGHLDGAAGVPGLVSVHLVPAATGRWNVVAPGTRIQDVVPDRGMIGTDDGVGLFCDEPPDLDVLDDLDPDGASYLSLRLMAGGPASGPAASFLDADRFLLPPYTAELLLAVPGAAGADVVHLDADHLDGGHGADATDTADLDFALDAIAAAAAVRDTVLVDLDVATRRSLRVRSFDDLSLT